MNNTDTLEIQSIIHEMREGNLDNFDIFYEHTKKQVYYAIITIIKNKATAEDLMQDVYMRFLNNLSKYKDKTNVIAFLVTIARNLSINEFNKRKKESFIDISDRDEDLVGPSYKKETPLLDLVEETLEGVELEVFVLHTIDELKHREIAKILGKPLGTITWIYNNAVKKMKKKVGEINE